MVGCPARDDDERGRRPSRTKEVGIGCCDNSCVWVKIAEALWVG